MKWQDIIRIHFNQEIKTIISNSVCDNCGEKDDLYFSEVSATVLCEICKEMNIRICQNRNARIIKIEKVQKDYQDGSY